MSCFPPATYRLALCSTGSAWSLCKTRKGERVWREFSPPSSSHKVFSYHLDLCHRIHVLFFPPSFFATWRTGSLVCHCIIVLMKSRRVFFATWTFCHGETDTWTRFLFYTTNFVSLVANYFTFSCNYQELCESRSSTQNSPFLSILRTSLPAVWLVLFCKMLSVLLPWGTNLPFTYSHYL